MKAFAAPTVSHEIPQVEAWLAGRRQARKRKRRKESGNGGREGETMPIPRIMVVVVKQCQYNTSCPQRVSVNRGLEVRRVGEGGKAAIHQPQVA